MAASLLTQTYAGLVQQHTLLPAAQAYTSSSSSSNSSRKCKSSRAKSQAAAADGSSSGSSSSSAPTVRNRAGRDMGEALRSWRDSAQHVDRLPAAHSELAKLLGTDLRTMVWAAITLNKMAVPALPMTSFLGAYVSSVQQQVPLHSSLQDLHQLLPTVLLYWAAHQPGGVYDSDVHQAVDDSELAMQYWQHEHQLGSTNSQQHQDDAAAAALGAAPQSRGLPTLHPCVVEEGLPLVLLLLTRLQQQPASLPIVGGTGRGAVAADFTAAHVTKPLTPTVATQVPGVELLHRLWFFSPDGSAAAACATPAAGRARAPAPAADASASRGHANPAQFCTSISNVLEAFVRANAQEGISSSSTLLGLAAFFPEDPTGSLLRCLPALAVASGSEAQLQLLGLLRSFLKLSAMGQQREHHSPLVCATSCSAAASYVLSCQADSANTDGAAAASTYCRSSKLPWLHLLGHCCMRWSGELQLLGDAPDQQRAVVVVAMTRRGLFAGVSAAAAAAALSGTLQQQQQQAAATASVEGLP